MFIDGFDMKKIMILNSNVGKVCSISPLHCRFPSSSLAPRVGALNFHSLLELRRGLQYGMILDSIPPILILFCLQ